MASCSQVNSFLQAHLDGELDASEERILEAHLNTCAACRSKIKVLAEFHEELIGSCAMHRLQRSLCSSVLAHLPEMAPQLNHGSHPTDPGLSPARKTFWVPAALAICAAVVLVGLLGLALYSAENAAPTGATIGMVVYTNGPGALQKNPQSTRFEPARLKSLVSEGEELETLASTQMAVALARGSSIKLNEDTHVAIHDSRNIFVYRGQAFFDVGRDRRHFFVNTPAGEILVFGTTFVVDVENEATTVTVFEGDVLVSTPEGRSALSHGKQSILRKDRAPSSPEAVADGQLQGWMASMKPDAPSLSLFRQTIASQEAVAVAIPAESVYAVRNLAGREIDGVMLRWTYDGNASGHCGYFLHVADSDDNLLFLDSIEGSVFDDVAKGELWLTPIDGPITGVDVIHIRLVPDFATGSLESTLQVNAVVR
ncbi:MAG: FecR domain-containing protein [Candidatus Hydrogenedentes bacterium]|nr:FecR domain-containing protein [Candidatus Hydrogenedentota bacterium]